MSDEATKVGVIGLGAMGAPMARNLARAGLLAAVWNRTASKSDELVAELGVVRAHDPADLARRCDLILTCVSADGDLLAVIDALLPGLSAGKIIVDTSTVQPVTAIEIAQRLEKTGCAFLDAPVSGGVEGARQGSLAIMVGGSTATLERARPVLNAIGNRIAHMGPVGNGQATKAVNQIMCAGINHAVTEALAFAEDQGLPLDKVIEVVSGGAAGNWFLEKRGPTMVRCTFAPGFKVALHYKDLAICKAIAEQRGVMLPVVELTLTQYRRLLDAGYGDEDISALYREKRKLFDKECESEAQ
ncbi:MAG: NAD(P)-dependent oxidoreductase [Gammaproteobacteria bacterium]|nr:NAD(P)-dependent oxidoreductase [Gammaproteobacteria bacterium]